VPGYDRVVPTGRKYILRAEALIKLAPMGLKPWAESFSPFWGTALRTSPLWVQDIASCRAMLRFDFICN
jgi:hypothetical protein